MRSGLENLRRVLVDRQREALATPGSIRDRSLGFSLTLFEHARDHIDLIRGWSAAAPSPLVSLARCSPIWCVTNLRRQSKRNPRTLFRENLSSNMSLAPIWPC